MWSKSLSFFLSAGLAMLAWLPMVPASAADGGTVDEGIEYKRIVPPEPTRVQPGKVEVVELFWYGCPHCYRFEPHLEQWLEANAEKVELVRIPAQLNPGWRLHAAAYYVAEALQVLDKIHTPLFKAIHEDKQRLDTLDQVIAFFEQQGVSRDDFMKAYHSFAVRVKLKHADALVKRYGARSVPSIVIDGRYFTNATMAGGRHEDLLKVMDHLVNQQQQRQETAAQ